MDFLWKSPNFIDGEVAREKEKLWAYFPDTGDEDTKGRNAELRKMRAAFEGRKLFGVFPTYLAQSNLYLASSLFERNLVEIARLHEREGSSRLQDARGAGIDKYFRYFRNEHIFVEEVDWYDVVLAVKSIRNCMLHANGDLSLSRDRQFVEQVIRCELFKPLGRRGDEGMFDKQGRREIEIKGDRVHINFYFPFRAAIAYSEFLYGLIEVIPAALKIPPVPYIPG